MQPKRTSQQSLAALIAQTFNFRRITRCFLLAVIPGGLCYTFLLVVLTTSGFTPIQAIRDSAQQTETSSWLGLISNIGVLLMVSAAVICFFSLSVRSRTNSNKQRECLLLIGLFSAFLAIDDFFLLHDRYINERLIYIAYAFCLVALLCRHVSRISKVDASAFLIAGGLLALSVLTDVVQSKIPFSNMHVQVFEEGFKFMGMATWLYFSHRMAASYLTSSFVAKGV